MSPTLPEAQAIESRKVQTLLKIRIEAPISNISIQMISSFSYFGLIDPRLCFEQDLRLSASRHRPEVFHSFLDGRLRA